MTRNFKAIGQAKPANKAKAAAEVILEVIKEKGYANFSGEWVDLSEPIRFMLEHTYLYEDPLPPQIAQDLSISETTFVIPTIEVVNETTGAAAARLLAEKKESPVALNFAAARNPGGGFLHGAMAQEEALCRCSALYASLLKKPIYYNKNIMQEDHYYTDHMIYSPYVPFFRDEHLMFLDQPFSLSIITAPAPNAGAIEEPDQKKLETIIARRALRILQIARYYKHKTVILGAWGCGVFGNDPKMVAQAFLEALAEVPYFEHVCFPVYDTRPGTPVFNAFHDELSQ